MSVVYRQGNHSKVNIWMESDTIQANEHIAMATSVSWAQAICEALNAQGAPDRARKERAIQGLETFLDYLDDGGGLRDFPAELIARLRGMAIRRWMSE